MPATLRLNRATWTKKLNTELTDVNGKRDRRYRHAKITSGDADVIRMLLKQGYTQTMVAEAFGVSQPQISRVMSNQQWVK